MADYLTTDTELTSIANAIRSKGETSAALSYPSGFISAIQAIQTAGTYQSKVISPTESQQIVSPDSGYDALSSVTVNAISSTYIGTDIIQKAAATYTPTTITQSIASGQYLSGVQTIAGDSNLVAANIASGVTIFGITGTYAGESFDPMTTQEIWEAAESGWGSVNPSYAAAMWSAVTEGWNVSSTITDAQISAAVDLGWR